LPSSIVSESFGMVTSTGIGSSGNHATGRHATTGFTELR
jgi:hypothetical protein